MVTESDDKYTFSANFDERRTSAVNRFVNSSLSPNVLFSGGDDRVASDTKLDDGTTFKLQSSPGELIVKVNKMENSPASVQRIRRMCEGIKEVITE